MSPRSRRSGRTPDGQHHVVADPGADDARAATPGHGISGRPCLSPAALASPRREPMPIVAPSRAKVPSIRAADLGRGPRRAYGSLAVGQREFGEAGDVASGGVCHLAARNQERGPQPVASWRDALEAAPASASACARRVAISTGALGQHLRHQDMAGDRRAGTTRGFGIHAGFDVLAWMQTSGVTELPASASINGARTLDLAIPGTPPGGPRPGDPGLVCRRGGSRTRLRLPNRRPSVAKDDNSHPRRPATAGDASRDRSPK